MFHYGQQNMTKELTVNKRGKCVKGLKDKPHAHM